MGTVYKAEFESCNSRHLIKMTLPIFPQSLVMSFQQTVCVCMCVCVYIK